MRLILKLLLAVGVFFALAYVGTNPGDPILPTALNLAQSIWTWLFVMVTAITLHEWGHFYAMRLLGVDVVQFGIGMGKELFGRTDKRGTRWSVCMFPIGGFVRPLSEKDSSTKDLITEENKHRTMEAAKVWRRMIIVSAGVVMNMLTAYVVFTGHSYLYGTIEAVNPGVQKVLENTPAERSGLRSGDKITHVNGQTIRTMQDILISLVLNGDEPSTLTVVNEGISRKVEILPDKDKDGRPIMGIIPTYDIEVNGAINPTVAGLTKADSVEPTTLQIGDIITQVNATPVSTPQEVLSALQNNGMAPSTLIVIRKGERTEAKVTPYLDENNQHRTGIALTYEIDKSRERFVASLSHGASEIYRFTAITFTSLGKLVTGQLSIKTMSGPVGIGKVTGDTYEKAGMNGLFKLLALISISLAIMNALPILPLDGGHFFMMIIESIKGSPVSDGFQNAFATIGIGLFLTLFVVITFFDLGKIFG